MDLHNITAICFGSCYALALALELLSLRKRFGWHRMVLMLLTAAGLLAHTIYLLVRIHQDASPLTSPAEWFAFASWVPASIYFYFMLVVPQSITGLFILPIALGLTIACFSASTEPFAPQRAHIWWGQAHGWLLLLATLTVNAGFLAGVMYLLKSWRLKQKKILTSEHLLPSLELLETINSKALGLSAIFMTAGFASGWVLAHRKQAEEGALWQDPTVWTSAFMLVWLLIAECFRWFYPAARQGRKVAYLTLASFVFLLFVLISILRAGGVHGSS